MRRAIRDGRMEIPGDVRKAGVLILFYVKEDEIYIAFIKRNEYPGVHSGQVSFPGGGREDADADIISTALRETEEEIGINRNLIIQIGAISELFIPPSNFVVTPVIGYLETLPHFTPDPDEVDRVLEIRLKDLLEPGTVQEKEITIFPDIKLRVPCFFVEGEVIWGATAMMLCELLDLVSPLS